jgi:hypothetical protein
MDAQEYLILLMSSLLYFALLLVIKHRFVEIHYFLKYMLSLNTPDPSGEH